MLAPEAPSAGAAPPKVTELCVACHGTNGVGITADYPRFPQPPRHILFDRLGDMAYTRLRRLPWIAQGGFDLIHAHQALPDGAIAAHLSRDLGVPYVVTVHGVDVHHGLSRGGAVAARTAEVLQGAAVVIVVSDMLARKLTGYVSLNDVRVVQNGGPADTTSPTSRLSTGRAAASCSAPVASCPVRASSRYSRPSPGCGTTTTICTA